MKAFTIVGASSDIGRVIVSRLQQMGHKVRKVSRTDGISLDDEHALFNAFLGSDGAYVVIPFDMMAPDLHKREDEIGEKLARAVSKSGINRVVFLSGLSANLKKGSSLGASIMEERLNQINIKELIHLRCGFFMENFLKGMGFVQQVPTGFYSTPFRGDRPMPMIACQDIGEIISEILTNETFPQSSVRELLGARDYTFNEATQIMGAAMGEFDIKYRQVSIEEGYKGMIEMGVSPSFAQAVMETSISFNEGERWGNETRSSSNTTKTTLEEWARTMLGKSVNG